MGFEDEFDAVICLCQGAFGMMTADGDDAAVVAGMARALRAGGRLALSAFNAYFAVKYHVDADFDAATGVSHEVTEIRSEAGEPRTVDLWTGCYTPRELRLLLGSQASASIRSPAWNQGRTTPPADGRVTRVPGVRHAARRVTSGSDPDVTLEAGT